MKESGTAAIVLLSGGLDSTTTLAIAKAKGFKVHALSFRYGQRHDLEVQAAGRVAKAMGVDQHVVISIDLRTFGGSALTSETPVPKSHSVEGIGNTIPSTYVPARNTIFLSFGLAWAETLGIDDIFVGVNALDYSGYPDCRPEYIAAYEVMANLATRAGVENGLQLKIHTPLIDLTKAQIIEKGLELDVDYSITVTCYDPSSEGEACGHCDACLLRLKGFAENGITDPVPYAESRPK